MFLFQQTLVLCRAKESSKEQQLEYENHVNINKVRVRDTVGENENLFELHKLENTAENLEHCADIKTVIMRLECQSETEKNEWVKAINSEVKQLRNMAKTLSSQLFLID